jgi:hypothetical protein
LDLEILCGKRFARVRRFDYRPFLKPASLRRVLAVGTAHPPHVHISWPVQYLRRLRARSSSLDLYREAALEASFRLREFGFDGEHVLLIQQIADLPTVHRSCYATVLEPKDRIVWIRIPYHPLWFAPINRAFVQLTNDVDTNHLLTLAYGRQQCFVFRAAWMLSSLPLAANVARWSQN